MGRIDYAIFATDAYMRPSIAASPLIDGHIDYPDGATEIIDSALIGDFAAFAYLVGTEVVIAFRGTDNFGDWMSYPGLVDPINYADGDTQLQAAFTFYQDVVAELANNYQSVTTITLTGHSMGGGFAGVVASVYGLPAFLYDPLPYADAATYIHGSAASAASPPRYDGSAMRS